jgi:hypothetical protein
MASRFANLTQTTIFIIFAVVLSIILLNYFNIDMTSNDTLKLNRYAIYEGFEENMVEKMEDNTENKKKKSNLIIQ